MRSKPIQFIVVSPVYETMRYGHDKIARLTADAHVGGKLSKFVIGPDDLIDPSLLPTPDNFRFESIQADQADVVIFFDFTKQLNITIKSQCQSCEWHVISTTRVNLDKNQNTNCPRTEFLAYGEGCLMFGPNKTLKLS
jgi:hypothetical protein